MLQVQQVSCPAAQLTCLPPLWLALELWLALVLLASEPKQNLAAWEEVSIQVGCTVSPLARLRDLDFTPKGTRELQGLHWVFE